MDDVGVAVGVSEDRGALQRGDEVLGEIVGLIVGDEANEAVGGVRRADAGGAGARWLAEAIGQAKSRRLPAEPSAAGWRVLHSRLRC